MSPAQKAYVRKETAISAIINAVISAGFVWAVFGASHSAEVWGTGGVAVDFVPQTFMVSLMSVLVPTLLTRKRVRNGEIPGIQLPAWRLPRNVAVRAALVAIVATPIFAGLAATILAVCGTERLDLARLATIKVAYGALLACIVTPIALNAALRERVVA